MTIEDIKTAAAVHFNENAQLKEVYAFSDGNIFLEGSENYVKLHERTTGKKAFTVTRTEALGQAVLVDDSEEEGTKQPFEIRIDNINAMVTVEEVEAALVGEKAKTVLSAGAAKIEALKEAAAGDPRE